MVGLKSYDNGAKRTWRGWAWNRIVERLRVPARDAVVLYLSGPDDWGREWATRKGFRSQNLIAVDTVEENIAKVRRCGGIGICADLQEVLSHWNNGVIHAIVADFCSGLEAYPLRLATEALFCRGVTDGSTIVVNLQRGREHATRDLIEEAKACGGSQKTKSSATHRGELWVSAAAVLIAQQATGQLPSHRLQKSMQTLMRPEYQSYRGSRVWFDSAVVSWPGVLFRFVDRDGCRRQPAPETCRKLAALKAVRTRLGAGLNARYHRQHANG